MLEFLIELLGELFIQVVLEVLAEVGLHSIKETTRRRPNPVLAALGYVFLGAAAGGVSLLFAPASLVPAVWRMANLVLAPVLAGAAMVGLGAWRAKRGQSLVRLDRFLYGYVFALALAAVRFQFAA